MRTHIRRLLPALLIVATPVAAQQPRPIRLVVAIAIDQFRADYLDRWASQYTGGLARLLKDGVFYPHGEQDHAITETAPGHSTMMSGRSPASTGILANDVGVPDPTAPLVGESGTSGGASPRRFQGTTLLDWMIAADSGTRALSVSRKDRGAILPAGRAKVPVYWYNRGTFTTSRYYTDSLPAWLVAWNARNPADQLKGTSWTLLLDSSRYAEADNRPFEAGGSDVTFPHRIPDDPARAASALVNFPVMDSLTLDVALAGTAALHLGQRNGADFLAISLSTTDAIGHKWGPGSREIHDQVLRLDHWLGWFLDSLSRMVPLDQVVISVTADHGVTEYPEAGNGGRISLRTITRQLNSDARARWRIDLGAGEDDGLLSGDFDALAARGVNIDSLADAVAEQVRTMAGVRKVFTPKSLAKAGNDLDAARWRRQIVPGTSWLVALAIEPGWVFGTGRTSTAHGTTNPDDVNVPILFRVPDVAAARVERTARTVDIAPTLAKLLGVTPTQALEGSPLPEVTGRRR